MKKLEAVAKAIESGAYLKKSWVLTTTAIVKSEHINEPSPWHFMYDDNGWFTFDNEMNRVEITDIKQNKAPFNMAEPLEVPAGIIPSIKKDTVTTWGVLILNLYVFHYAFGEKATYWNEEWTPKKVDAYWKGLIESGEVTMDELLKSSAGASQLTAFNTMSVPSFTQRSISTCPEATALLKKLSTERKDKLKDPAVVADILNEVYKVDKAWMEQDPDNGMGFLVGEKPFRVVRMDLLYSQVFEEMEGDSILAGPLKEGLNRAKFTAAVNDSAKSSLDRGFNTALGGVAVKEIIRLLFGVKVDADDCGVTYGERITAHPHVKNKLVDSYYLKAGKPVLLTDDNFKEVSGKEIILRSPMACKGNGKKDGKSFCKICVGKVIAENPEAITGQGISWGSVMMELFMQSMHGIGLVTEDYKLERALS